MLSMFDLPHDEHVYTFVDRETGQPCHIAVNMLRNALKLARVQPQLCQLGGTLVDALERGDLGVEEPHALRLPDAALETPLIVCQWGESDHVLADGAHRLWRRWKRGDSTFKAYMVREPVWRLFTVHDMPGDGAFWEHFNRSVKVR